ncbi:HipA domain-containing protein [Paeniglutamicibacter sp. R2-26]|uniref:HipA domain-containing protein n=1 Tax=Paeniglutamicibacter sp. R2-26 TaxID=3144417 RepID=UPI003EE65CCA
MDELHAFIGGALAGIFHQREGCAYFEYDPGYAGIPLSLSLPPDRDHSPAAALAFLDNLLPDNENVRLRWVRAGSLPAASPFTLLAACGEDVAGAVSLSADPGLPNRTPAPLLEATEEDIARRITALRTDAAAWTDPEMMPRASIAGMQGKFSLARVDGRWFWPTYETPSTHIFKPPAKQLRSIECFEHLSLELARTVGVEASRSSVMEFGGQPVFAVERWDRARGVRLPAEDMNQALGLPTDGKYDVEAPQVARLLGNHGLGLQFVRQLAFNVSLGNTDAHVKNYSLLHASGRTQLAPLYDTVPVHLWPHYDTRYAMAVGTARLPAQLTEANWRRFAAASGLDPDLVCQEAFAVMRRVVECYQEVFAAGGVDQARMSMIARHTNKLRRVLPAS